MDHPRFVEGAITTAFIAEEYPEGFHGRGAAARDAAAGWRRLAAAMHRVRGDPARRGSPGRWTTTSARSARDWVVLIAGARRCR